jgi:hypothetical protein
VSHSTDPKLSAALDADAAKLDALGQDPGAEVGDYDYDLEDSADVEDDDDWLAFGEDDCGRWINGRLTHSCTLAGTEDCDWECPLRGTL